MPYNKFYFVFNVKTIFVATTELKVSRTNRFIWLLYISTIRAELGGGEGRQGKMRFPKMVHTQILVLLTKKWMNSWIDDPFFGSFQ